MRRQVGRLSAVGKHLRMLMADPQSKVLGSAWPGMFQQGPETGPPVGKDYHTVDYGLFEPFVLKQVIEK